MSRNLINATRSYLRYQSLPDISSRLDQIFVENQLHKLIKTTPASCLELVILDRKYPFTTSTDSTLRSNYDTKPSSIAIFFDSVGAPKQETERILSIYHKLGLNTLLVKPNSLHFVSATNAQALINDVMKNLDGNILPFDVDKYIVHSNSSGSLLYALFLQELDKSKPALKNRLYQRLIGQIFDSPLFGYVDSTQRLDQLPLNLIPGFSALQRLLGHDLAALYSDAVVYLNRKTPISECLILHSADDVVANETDKLITKWRSQHNHHITVSCWFKSHHAHHFARHPIKYTKAIQAFIAKVTLDK